MTDEHVRNSIEGATAYLAAHPEKWRGADPPATATWEGGLRCRATGPEGAEIVTDMPPRVGGGGTAPRPGWFMRAALATCDATVIAMRAAQLGIALSRLEVTVESESDHRGLLGMDDAVTAGPVQVVVRVKLAAEGVSAERLHDIVHWAERHSPVGDALQRAIDTRLEIEVA